MNYMNEVARRKVNGPDGWEICVWKRIGDGRDFVVEGGVPRILTRGPRKGRKRWDGPRLKTVVTGAEIDAEHARYEAETGNCGDCGGKGEVFASWSVTDGTMMRPCQRCNATGKTPNGGGNGVGILRTVQL